MQVSKDTTIAFLRQRLAAAEARAAAAEARADAAEAELARSQKRKRLGRLPLVEELEQPLITIPP